APCSASRSQRSWAISRASWTMTNSSLSCLAHGPSAFSALIGGSLGIGAYCCFEDFLVTGNARPPAFHSPRLAEVALTSFRFTVHGSPSSLRGFRGALRSCPTSVARLAL